MEPVGTYSVIDVRNFPTELKIKYFSRVFNAVTLHVDAL